MDLDDAHSPSSTAVCSGDSPLVFCASSGDLSRLSSLEREMPWRFCAARWMERGVSVGVVIPNNAAIAPVEAVHHRAQAVRRGGQKEGVPSEHLDGDFGAELEERRKSVPRRQ